MPTIIVSYRREDSRHITGRIVDRLEQHYGKGQVFMDIDAIPYGMDFRQHLRNMLDRCDVLVAVVGPHWIGADASGQPRISDPTDWVRIEIETALSKDIPVIPVLIDRAHMPKPHELPESLRDFAYRQGADLDTGRDFHPHMDRLIHAISESVVRREAEAKRRKDEDESHRQHEAAEQKRKEDEERLRQEAKAKRPAEEEPRPLEETAEQKRTRAEEHQLSDPIEPRQKSLPRRALLIALAMLGIGIWFASRQFSPPVQAPAPQAPAAGSIDQPHDVQPPATPAPGQSAQSASAIADLASCKNLSGDTAIAACSRAITSGMLSGTDLVLAFLNRGAEYYQQQDYDHAIADFNDGIKLDPRYALAFYNRGLAYKAKQDYDHALADYGEAIKLDPEYALAFRGRGNAYYAMQDYDRALTDYNEAIKLDPDSAVEFNNRGNAYYAKQDYDHAIADYNEAIKLDPKYALAFYNRGLIYSTTQDYDRAIAEFTEAIKLNPKYAKALYKRGLARQQKGDRGGGASDLAAARAIDPNVGK
jgi:tetratricopeptide (TPR) repeat protein